MNIHKKSNSITIDIFWFFLLMYPFNCGIASVIYPNELIYQLTVVISILGMVANNSFESIKRKTPITLAVIIISMITFFVMIWGSICLPEKSISFGQLFFVFLPFLILQSPKLTQGFWRVVKLFLFEHLLASYCCIILKDFYRTYILAIISSVDPSAQAIYAFNWGYNPGLTLHYSTNGIYLTISSLYFFSDFWVKRDKKNAILMILSTAALLSTGKRAHPVFVVFSILVVYFFSNNKRNIGSAIKKIFFITLIAAFSIIMALFLSNYFPAIMVFYNRLMETVRGGDFLTGRGKLYSFAISLWKRNILFGCGWGAYEYYYKLWSGTYYAAHNVFLQLLCETGILGLLFFSSIMFFCLYISIKNIHQPKKMNCPYWIGAMNQFSCAYQIFFLSYCLTGNPLYDPQCYVIYYICIGFSLALQYNLSYFLKKG